MHSFLPIKFSVRLRKLLFFWLDLDQILSIRLKHKRIN